jgi:uracil-DNA glycosylase family 4
LPTRPLPAPVENVTDRARNPFGMTLPCGALPAGHRPVPGYGDANADFHVVGDHPGVHGGATTGVPFTGSTAGERLQGVLHETGFAVERYADAPDYENLFTSYRCGCPPVDGAHPSAATYRELERFFDAELRAINPHVILPVGHRATAAVLEGYTTRAEKVPHDAAALHATDVRGRGFLVVPVREPTDWVDGDRAALVEKLEAVLASDYRQTKGVATRVG